MISPLVWWLASLATQLWCYLARPSHVECPPSTFVIGVRPSGESSCVSVEDPRPESTAARYAHRDAPSIAVRVWCSGNQRPIVVSERRIECRKGSV